MNMNLNANLVLGGGGIKGIAYVGMLEEAENRGIYFRNISGVSAGAIAGACIAAGYQSKELKKEFYEFDFGKLNIDTIAEKVPVIERYMEFCSSTRFTDKSIYSFLNMPYEDKVRKEESLDDDFSLYRGNFFKNIVKFSKQGCLFDGDLLEEWVYKLLARKGIRTFADLRGGVADYANPMGYKVRMTAVDAKRGKVIVLPDDMKYYGFDPDKLEVAKAVRMSSSVPFAFKPVEFYTNTGGKTKKHYIIDGGVLDSLPVWTISPSMRRPMIACQLNGGNPKKVAFDPLSLLKGFITAVHDIGVPKYIVRNCYFISINTSKVSFLDFNLSDEDKEYLYKAGKKASIPVFNRLIYVKSMERLNLFGRIRYLLSARGF
ncbi:patatin-like phospholipase family protein [Acetivibrio clariflavus]|uniref:patatin-like phospholipase family protein n=1 Tax=Acetivibrio clariflavus TaxID=288965 RepID=UPI0031F4A17A